MLVAGQAQAGGPFRSLNQALASQSSAAVTAAASRGGVVAAQQAGLGAQNLANAAKRFISLSQALNAQAAAGGNQNVPNGIAPGGLQQDVPAGWVGADPSLGSKVVGGITDVTVTQTAPVADINWSSFNIGSKTKLIFNQSAGGTLASSWLVINSVNDPSLRPSQILGSISAPGYVYILDANGIAFGAGSQVNVGSLVAATANIAQSQFGINATGGLTFNLYGAAAGNIYAPTFTGGSAEAAVTVAPGAEIETPVPSGATAGGYVMLLGGQVSNAGMIGTPQGQTILAAGTDFTLAPGYSPTGNATATTLGSEIAVSNGGTATNTGIVVSDQGDITMVGHVIDQAGVLLSTTTVDQRGTVHLLTDTTDSTAQVLLAPGSVTEIWPEDNGQTALDSQRAANIAISAAENAARPNAILSGAQLNDVDSLPDQAGSSRIEISTGGTVTFQSGALAIAQGGQVAVAAGQQIVVQTGATLDVSGTSDAVLPAAMDSILVNVQPYQLRDSAGNRNGNLKSTNVYVDALDLVEIASGAYAGNVYTQGGLLEVSGYLGLVGHGINEWTAIGGQVILQSQSSSNGTQTVGEVITEPGSVINLTGGLVTYLAGDVPQSYVQAADGQIYNVNDAPGNIVYTGVYTGEQVAHPRWHITDNYDNPLLTPSTLYQGGYVEGRDAGTLTVSTPTAMLQGAVDSGVTTGQYQNGARPADVTDPFLLAQSVLPLAGGLQIGDYIGGALNATAETALGGNSQFSSTVLLQSTQGTAGTPDTIVIDAGQLSQDGFANVTIVTAGNINVSAPVTVANGGTLTLSGTTITDTASLTARGGNITLSNLLPFTATGTLSAQPGSIAVASGVVLDTQGVWTNAEKDALHLAGEALANGGTVTIDSSGGLDLAAGSTIDASSGGALLANGKLQAATGGSVSITANEEFAQGQVVVGTAPVTVASAIAAYGVAGGGVFSLNVPEVDIGAPGGNATNATILQPSFFSSGFSSYVMNGFNGAAVAPGEQVQVVMPVFIEGNAPAVPSGGDPNSAYQIYMPALYVENAGSDSFSQRRGASFSLTSNIQPQLYDGGGGDVTIYAGASVTVDPGQSITLSSYGQATVSGTLTAHSGTISVLNTRSEFTGGFAGETPSNYLPGLSVWIDDGAKLDASGTAVSFTDSNGRIFGTAGSGGLIQLGIPETQQTEGTSTYAQIVVLSGAVLNASGASQSVTMLPGAETGSVILPANPVTLVGNGGTISARSYTGIALDGDLLAQGGGPGAAGGVLVMKLDDLPAGQFQLTGLPAQVFTEDQILVSQNFMRLIDDPGLTPGEALPADTIGVGRISVAQLAAGGFDDVSLQAENAISFDGSVNLTLGRALTLISPVIGETQADASVKITAPYVDIEGDLSSGSAPALLNTLTSASTLEFDAGLIDIQNATNFGGEVVYVVQDPDTETLTSLTDGFSQITFASTGDIRVGGVEVSNFIDTAGNITFRSAQLYPVTDESLQVLAGDDRAAAFGQPEYLGTITVQGLGGMAPAAPFSVGGTIQLVAGSIVQDGVIRAPEGRIVLGNGDEIYAKDAAPAGGNPDVTTSVVLDPGSVTSVSLDGLVIPYGGTLDGVNYIYAGNAVSTFDPLVALQGQIVAVSPGAVIDLRGGGTLTGAAFVPGRGGSVDVNTQPLISSVSGTVAATSSDNVYAIIPGYSSAYAPLAPGDAGYNTPAIGEQITVAAGEVPGLAAGTYTLLPAYYDQLPGAYRVELSNTQLAPNFAEGIGNFTTEAALTLSTANTSIAGVGQVAALFTTNVGVQQLAQYDTESYNAFEINAAATFDSARPLLPQDAKTLLVNIDSVSGTQQAAVSFAPGTVLQAPAQDGYGATVEIASIAPIDVLPAEGGALQPVAGLPNPVGIAAATLDALNAPRLVIGGTLAAPADGVVLLVGEAPVVEVESGANLTAGDVMLTVIPSFLAQSSTTNNTSIIDVAQGATISTIGQSTTAYGLANGYIFNIDNGVSLGSSPTLDISNTENQFVPAVSSAGTALISVATGATLLAGGSLNFVAPPGTTVQIGQAAIGGKYVDLEVSSINIGSPATLAADAANLPAGFLLDTSILQTLLDGDPAAGVPAASELILTANQSLNILGSVALNTGSTELVLNTPAIYGYGAESDAVSITAKDFVWSGISTVESLADGSLPVSATPGGQIAGSSSNVIGSLLISADTITLGYGPLSQPDDQVTLDRIIAGFSDVTLQGSAEITANNQSALSVYQTIPNFGQAGVGGNLTFDTPLLTTASAAVLSVQAGGAFSLANSGTLVGNTGSVTTLGGSIAVTAQQVTTASAIALPSGSLSLTADGSQQDISTQSSSATSTTNTSTVVTDTVVTVGTITGASIDLLAGTQIDVSGRAVPIFDQVAESPGGSLSLEAASGVVTTTTVTTTVTGDGPSIPNSVLTTTSYAPLPSTDLTLGNDITVAQGAAVNVSSPGAAAGAIAISALGGTVDVEGTLSGAAEGAHQAGTFSLIAGAFGGESSFDQLNSILQTGGFTGARNFELATGNIIVDETVQAHTVNISADTGSLEVSGTIDASGAGPGSIALSAGGNLTLDATALLDAHATGVSQDSYGLDIDAANRAHVSLTTVAGTLTLDQGATIDELYSTADPAKTDGPQGVVVFNAPRNGGNDANFNATGPVTIQGAASVGLVAWASYAPGDANGTIVQDNGGTTPVSATGTVGLNQINTVSQAYISAALAAPGPGLASIASALSAYGSLAGLLQPGVEIDSSAATGGNLTISGDLDFHTFRYGPNADPATGAGTPGVILFRASNDLTVNGSVSDGFLAPPDSLPGNQISADTGGWVYAAGTEPLSADLLLPSSAIAIYKPNGNHPQTTSEIELAVGTSFNTTRPISLNYAITIAQANIRSNVTIPFAAILGAPTSAIPAGGWVATAPILNSAGVVLYATGQLIPGGTVLAAGDVIQPGTVLPVQVTAFDNTVVPPGTMLDIFASPTIKLLQDTAVLPEDAFIPSDTKAAFAGVFANDAVLPVSGIDLRAPDADGVQGYLYPLAEMLPNGSQSWSMNFVAGANLGSADSLAVLPKSVLSAGGAVPAAENDSGAPGSLLLDDQHYANSNTGTDAIAAFSVIRTGTGDLNLVAGGDFDQSSLYGIYTAGTQTSADTVGTNTDGFNAARYSYGTYGCTDCILPQNFYYPGNDITTINDILAASYQAYYPAGGGDVLVSAQGNLTGDLLGGTNNTTSGTDIGSPSDAVGNWLWRQGSTQLGQPTSWWINFGTFVEPLANNGNDTGNAPQLVGFQGIGALGGGNVTVIAGGDAGQISDRTVADKTGVVRGEGLIIAVGSTGRLALGATVRDITGGGDINVDIGGSINPLNEAAYGVDAEANGTITDVRGNISVTAGAVGSITPTYSAGRNEVAPIDDPRAPNPFAEDDGTPQGGIDVVPGDGTVSIETSRDLVLAGAGDPGREPEQNVTSLAGYNDQILPPQDGNPAQLEYNGNDYAYAGGYSDFSLWQAGTAITLFSSGGNITPTTVPQDFQPGSTIISNGAPADYRAVYPPTLLVTAPSGNIIYGPAGVVSDQQAIALPYSLETAPAADGQVAFLAGGSIFANGYAIDISGANPADEPLPADPGFASAAANIPSSLNDIRLGSGLLHGGTPNDVDALFAFEADTPTADLHANDPNPALFYAAGGDITNFQTGETLNFSSASGEPITTWYIAAKPVWIEASEDIVSSGTRPALDPGSNVQENQAPDGATPDATTSGNLFLNTEANSISVVSAGRDILSGYFYVGGPGLLEVDAGRNLYQASTSTDGSVTLQFGEIRSLGSLIEGAPVSLTDGASIAVQAGVGAGGDYAAFADLYFNPANQANLSLPSGDPANDGKVQLVYATQLLSWLAANAGYTGGQAGAIAAFLALPHATQGVFVREVFFDELLASGRQYNDPDSRFYHDYARGQTAIDTLFPSTGTETTAGVPVGYNGSITAFSGTLDFQSGERVTPVTFDAGIATLFGGNVQVLDPGGQIELGTTGSVQPGSGTGIVTDGTGNIDIYALGSVLLGESRIFTTAGGNIQIWSSAGDINAGIGAKTTVSYNPPVLTYDNIGGITDTPTVPTDGAGIATLAPLPGIPAGDIDLTAPLGTIDAGEAGIRVSGNLNLAAARLANTTNIAVGGKTSGTASVNVASLGAVEAAGAAAGAASNAAQSAGKNQQNDAADTAAVVDVDVVSIGGSYEDDQRKKKRPAS
jgi:filamentous hemagglutinin family protein